MDETTLRKAGSRYLHARVTVLLTARRLAEIGRIQAVSHSSRCTSTTNQVRQPLTKIVLSTHTRLLVRPRPAKLHESTRRKARPSQAHAWVSSSVAAHSFSSSAALLPSPKGKEGLAPAAKLLRISPYLPCRAKKQGTFISSRNASVPFPSLSLPSTLILAIACGFSFPPFSSFCNPTGQFPVFDLVAVFPPYAHSPFALALSSIVVGAVRCEPGPLFFT